MHTSISEVKTKRTNPDQTNTSATSNTSTNKRTNTQSTSSVDPNHKPVAISQQSGSAIGKPTNQQQLTAVQQQDPSDSATTTYYYYDSQTNEQFVTKNMTVIDSLRRARMVVTKTETIVNPEVMTVETPATNQEEVINELELAATKKDSSPSLPKTDFSISGHVVPLYFGPSQTESAIDRSLELNDKCHGIWALVSWQIFS